MMSLIEKIQLLEEIADGECTCETSIDPRLGVCRSCAAGGRLNDLSEIASYNLEELEVNKLKEYHKIQSIYKRDEQTHKFIIGEFSLPEFEYLQHNTWIWDEKIDGTNIRVMWEPKMVFQKTCFVSFGGKTDTAQIPAKLVNVLKKTFTDEQLTEEYPTTSMCLYGEGYGAGIQKGGKYRPDPSFVLFDVKIDQWWLRRADVEDVASKLGLEVAPVVGKGTLHEAVEYTKQGFKSQWGDFTAEGLVLRPEVPLFTRSGERIVTKVKHKDF